MVVRRPSSPMRARSIRCGSAPSLLHARDQNDVGVVRDLGSHHGIRMINADSGWRSAGPAGRRAGECPHAGYRLRQREGEERTLDEPPADEGPRPDHTPDPSRRRGAQSPWGFRLGRARASGSELEDENRLRPAVRASCCRRRGWSAAGSRSSFPCLTSQARRRNSTHVAPTTSSPEPPGPGTTITLRARSWRSGRHPRHANVRIDSCQRSSRPRPLCVAPAYDTGDDQRPGERNGLRVTPRGARRPSFLRRMRWRSGVIYSVEVGLRTPATAPTGREAAGPANQPSRRASRGLPADYGRRAGPARSRGAARCARGQSFPRNTPS